MESDGNLEHWERLAAFHGTGSDDYYDVQALIRGDRHLGRWESDGLRLVAADGDVSGLHIAHVQSHIGFDSVNLARQGAHVTAFDFSPTALERLSAIADACGVEVETVLADSQQLATDTFASWHGVFDIVYATVGVIYWIADLAAWMAGVAALLRPGGRLLLIELHPLYCMPDSIDPLVLDFPYANDGGRRYSGTGSYANRDAEIEWTTDNFAWSLGETVTAAAKSGLRVTHLAEHLESGTDPRGSLLVREADGLFRLRLGSGQGEQPGEPLPILFTLVAQKESVTG